MTPKLKALRKLLSILEARDADLLNTLVLIVIRDRPDDVDLWQTMILRRNTQAYAEMIRRDIAVAESSAALESPDAPTIVMDYWPRGSHDPAITAQEENE